MSLAHNQLEALRAKDIDNGLDVKGELVAVVLTALKEQRAR